MTTFYQLLALLGGAVILWVLYRTIKAQPQQFSRENLSHSLSTMGILALLLLGFVAFLVLMIRHSS